jgi:hypothetical protein
MRPDDVGAALESAVVGVLTEFGLSHDLGDFDWRHLEQGHWHFEVLSSRD